MSSLKSLHLRLVGDEGPSAVPESRGQLSFSFAADRFILVLADITNASEQGFLELLERQRPDVVIELRAVPRFDFGRLNRKIVFEKFEEMNARYDDLIYTLHATSDHDAGLNPVFLARPLSEILRRVPRPQRALVLLDDPKIIELSMEVLPQRLGSKPRWHVRQLATQ